MKRFSALAARVGDEGEDLRLLVAALDKSVRIVPKEKLANVCTLVLVFRILLICAVGTN